MGRSAGGASASVGRQLVASAFGGGLNGSLREYPGPVDFGNAYSSLLELPANPVGLDQFQLVRGRFRANYRVY
jgi:hypothetical protein